MKRLFTLSIALLPFISLVMFSCSTYYTITPIGELTSASTRNIEYSKKYDKLKSYAGLSRTDVEAASSTNKNGKIKKKNPIIKTVDSYKAKSLNEAIDNVVKSVPGGEYINNLRVYQVNEIKGSKFADVAIYYVVAGDVWGNYSEDAEIKGFHKNDTVVFTYTKDLKEHIGEVNFSGEIGKQYKGKVIELKGGSAVVELENSTIIEIPYSFLKNLGH